MEGEVRPSITFTMEMVSEIAMEIGREPPASYCARVRPKTIAKQTPSRNKVAVNVKSFLQYPEKSLCPKLVQIIS